MRAYEFVNEVFNSGKFKDSITDQEAIVKQLLGTSEKLKDLSSSMELYVNQDEYYSIIRHNDVIGFFKISDVKIHDVPYTHIDLVYIFPKYRNGTGVKWLIHSIKLVAKNTLIADGAIFTDGGKLISSIVKYHHSKVGILNKVTGEIEPYSGIIQDLDKCYIFEK